MIKASKYQELVAQASKTKLIFFNPGLAKALNSIKAALFLNQLLYWLEKEKNSEWICKTIQEIKKEIALTRNEQDIAIKICKKHGLIESKLKGLPSKRHFKLNVKKIIDFLQKKNENST